MSTKGQFLDMGNITVHDTDSKGAKRRDKNAKEWSGGAGVLSMPDGSLVKVFVSVRKGSRPGTTNVGISRIVDNDSIPSADVPK